MDSATLNRYREIIKTVVHEYAQYRPSHGVTRTEVVIVPEIDHYALIHVGWHNSRRIHGMVFHIDIVDGKVWIEYDGTEGGVAGIPHQDIVLGFMHESVRPLSDFATG